MTRTGSLVCLALFAVAGPGDAGAAGAPERPTAGGRLAWALEGDLDLVGDLWADVPFSVGARDSFYMAIDTRTDMERPSERFTFKVQDLQYEVDLGWRGRPAWSGNRPVFVFAGQRGKEQVDAEGRAFVRYLGFGIESRRYREYAAWPACASRDCPAWQRLDWRIAAGPVVGNRGVEGTFVARGSARLWIVGARRSALGFDFRFEGLFENGDTDLDISMGPRISIPAGSALASLFLSYQRGDHPLARGEPLWLFGFAYEQGSGWPLGPPGEIEGLLAAGGGAGLGSGQLRLDFRSPPFAESTRVILIVDANVLVSESEGDLFYLYHLGLERPWRKWLAGAYFYHRSNHVLNQPGNGITSINVVEGGLESPEWDRPGRRDAGRHGRLEFRARAGYLLDSAFGEDQRWHAQGGVRFALAAPPQLPQPYLVAEFEEGDVKRRKYAIGIAPLPELEVQLEYRSDEQYISTDQQIWQLTARYGLGSDSRERPR